MRPNATEYAWTGRRRRAVELVAHDALTDVEIAADLKINKATLERWKRHPTFAAAVEEAKAALAEAIRAEGIANKQNRVDSYRRDFERTEQVIAERAKAYAAAPGGDSGLLVGQLKSVKHVDKTDAETGERVWTEEVWEYAVDTGLMNERIKLRKQVAQEVGDWEDKAKVDGGLTIRVTYADDYDQPA